jgi:hypothetical protein
LAGVGAGEGIAGVVADGIAEAVAAAGVEEDGFAQVDEACGRGAHGGCFVLPFFLCAELFLVAFTCSLGLRRIRFAGGRGGGETGTDAEGEAAQHHRACERRRWRTARRRRRERETVANT